MSTVTDTDEQREDAEPNGDTGFKPEPTAEKGGWRRFWIAMAFLAPALLALGALVVYPIFFTVVRSLFDRAGDTFVGVQNYREMFGDPQTMTAIVNNFIWVVVAPTLATIIGLIFAVLTDRIQAGTVFKTIIFMPMAISFLAVGIIFRLVYQDNPDIGILNAAAQSVVHVFAPPGDYPGAEPSVPDQLLEADGAFVTSGPVTPGSTVSLGLVGIAPDLRPEDGTAAPPTEPSGDAVTGTVWFDFSAEGGEPGAIDEGEVPLPGVKVEAVSGEQVITTTTTGADGTYTLSGLPDSGDLQLRLAESNFREPFGGFSWLGPTLVTPATILAFVWMWAGFAMMIISAGLSSIPRQTLEQARVDGATEWQVFRKVMAPQLKPVLMVVFVTLMINVMKIFDLVLIVPPGSSQDDATVLALRMWRVSFGGARLQGLGSAITVFLVLLVIPAMVFNIRRFVREER